MLYRRRFRLRNLPLFIGAAIIGVISGKHIFGPPLEDYWQKKLEEEAAVKGNDAGSKSSGLLEKETRGSGCCKGR